MADPQNGGAEGIQKNDLEVEGEEEVIGAVEDVKPEVEEFPIVEKDLSFDENEEEESQEKGPQIENLEEAFEFVLEADEAVPPSSETVTSTVGADENNGSPAVAVEEEEQSSYSVDLPETGSVLPLVEVACEEFQESTLSNADENTQTAQVERGVDLEGTDETSQQNAVNSELVANENIPQVEASNGNHAAAETPKTTENPPVISVTKRTSFLGCCGFLEVLRRSER